MTSSPGPAWQSWSRSLIRTKLEPPRAARGRVTRSALLARLTQGSASTLTVVMAPAGFGKTTLLAEWCETMRARDHHMAWVSLDSEDDELQQFGAYMVASLCNGPSGVGRHAADLLSNDPLTPAKVVVSALLNDIAACGRQIFLVLDDVDRLASTAVRATLLRMLRYAPENFHMVFGTRSEPMLALGQFGTDESLFRLDIEDMRFSADDANQFFAAASRGSLDRRSVELLTQATEGWVTGLQLASIALGRSADTAQVARDLAGARGKIDAYLNDAVLAQLSAPMLQFVLRTSILDRLGADVCDAVMGAGARSWEKLDWLEQQNLFIRALDEDRQWFRFHALMADALRRRLARQFPVELPGLHRRASHWFAGADLWPEAVRHALSAGEMQQAATWVERCAMELVDRSDVRTVLAWIGRLPGELVVGRPRLRLAKAWALVLSLQTAEGAQVVQELARDFEGSAGRERHSGQEADPTLAPEIHAVSAMSAVLSDDLPRALELGRAAAQAGPAPPWSRGFAHAAQIAGLLYEGRFDEVRGMAQAGGDVAGDARGLIFAEVYRESMFGLSAMLEGRLDDGVRILESALAHAERAVGRDSAAAAVPAGYLSALCYERNDLLRTRQLVSGYAAIAMEASPLGSLLRYCRAAARLYSRSGDSASALLILEEGRQIAISRQWLRLRAGCDAEAVRLHLHNGQFDQAAELATVLQAAMPQAWPSPSGTFIETWASYCELQARIDAAGRRHDQAAAMLGDLRVKLAATGMAHMHARASVLLALVLEQGDSRDAARASLEDALRYAHRSEMIGTFVDEGAPMRAMLRDWRHLNAGRAGIDGAFLDRLDAAFDDTSAAVPVAAAARGRSEGVLKEREREILEQLSHGLSNKEIGRALRLSPETVKWHLRNIFDRLGVSSRIEAVQIGLGLVRASPPGSDEELAPAVRRP